MRSPPKKESLGKMFPLRWSFGSKDRKKTNLGPEITLTQPGELVEYLESGRRPRCTKDPIVSLVASPVQVKTQPVESTPNGRTTVGGTEQGRWRDPDSPRVPEGQRRPGSERGSANTTKSRDENTVTRKTSKKKQEQQGKSQDGQFHRGSSSGLHPSQSEGRDSTLKKSLNQPAGATRSSYPRSHTQPTEASGNKIDDTQSLSVVKTGTIKKDVRGQEPCQARSPTSKNSSKLPVPNGAPSGIITEDKKANGTHRSSGRHTNKPLVNSKETHIKRAHSSSSLQTKTDLNLRRTMSLQRNGLAPQKGLMADKHTNNMLQRNRYSTTSLGRQRPVPESCF